MHETENILENSIKRLLTLYEYMICLFCMFSVILTIYFLSMELDVEVGVYYYVK